MRSHPMTASDSWELWPINWDDYETPNDDEGGDE